MSRSTSPLSVPPDLRQQDSGEVGGTVVRSPGNVKVVEIQPEVVVPRSHHLLAPARKYVGILERVMFQYILTFLLSPARKYVSILVRVMFQYILLSLIHI